MVSMILNHILMCLQTEILLGMCDVKELLQFDLLYLTQNFFFFIATSFALTSNHFQQ